jgi:predicted RNase H-like HicB family nuclease
MARYSEEEDDEYYFDESDSESEYDADDDDEDADTIPPMMHTTGEQGVEVSMEIDADGNEVWFAQDSRIPGSTSQGHSVEEAIDGVEERRRQYREMLRRSRKKRDKGG